MKKTITKPDGTTEVVEGTPEEIAQYERQLREGTTITEVPKKDGKKLLLEELAEFAKKIPKAELEEIVIPWQHPTKHSYDCPISVSQ